MDHRESQVSGRPTSALIGLALASVVLTTSSAAAQTPLAEVLPLMLGPGMVVAPGPGGTHANDFVRVPGEPNYIIPAFQNASIEAQQILSGSARGGEFTNGLIEQLTTFPIGSSSGGFLYGFDPAVGTFVRSTRSFGPSYSERPLTSGRNTFSIGFSAQNVEYDQFDGTSLDGDAVRFYFAHRDINTFAPPALTPERSDVMEAIVHLHVKSRTMLTNVTYGVTDRLDIGMTLPMVETTLEARVDKRILRLGTASDPTVHSFDGRGADTATATAGGTMSGLGDLRFQAKYNVLRRESFAAAAVWDVRVPTGDSRNLLGTGTLFTRVMGSVATGTRIWSLHGNGGATFASKNFSESAEFIGEPGDEINFSGGVDVSATPRVTVSSDLIGRRRMSGSFKLSPAARVLRYVTSASAPVQTQVVQEFMPVEYADRYLLQGVVGGKVSAWRTILLVGNVLFPLTDAGLRNKPALSIGLEYTF